MSAFQDIYIEHERKVYRFLLSLSGNEALAEELLQETFYQAFLHINQFEGRCSIFTWLCQIGKNAWLKELRRNRHFAEISFNELPVMDSSPQPEAAAIRKEEYLKARKAMECLEEPYQNVFVLHALGETPLKEIAQLYQKTESWARVTYYRARMKIIEEMKK